jgi:hypothetical protein
MATPFNRLLCCPSIEFLTSEGEDDLFDAFVSWLQKDIDTNPKGKYGEYLNTHTPVFSGIGRMAINSRQAQGFSSSGTSGDLRTRNPPANHPVPQMSPIHSNGVHPEPSAAQGGGGHHVARINKAINPTTCHQSPGADNNHCQTLALGARHRALSSGQLNSKPRNQPQPTATSTRNNSESGGRCSSANATANECRRRRLEINNSNEDSELDRELDNADDSLNSDMSSVPCIGQQTYSGSTANSVSRAAMNSTVVNESGNPPVR